MCLAGVSVRRVKDITEALWGTRASPSTVSNLNKKICDTIEAPPPPAVGVAFGDWIERLLTIDGGTDRSKARILMSSWTASL
jgi:hypothetical protein